MKLSKGLSILFSSALVFGTIAGTPTVGEAKTKKNHDGEQHIDRGLINYDRLTKALVERGVIDEDASAEEIEEAIDDFLASRNVPTGIDTSSKFGKKAFKSQLRAVGKAADKVTKLKDSSSSSTKGKPKAHTDNLVIALVEFPDREHNHVPKMSDTLWTEDFNPQHYKSMLFNEKGYTTPEGTPMTTMAEFYLQQSGKTWAVDGVVTDWIRAEKDYKYYGGNDKNGNDEHPRELVLETLERVGDTIQGHEDEYDQRDPYDIDGDGNLMEPDGMLDNLMLVHAGIGEETGEDDDAIWSHRWTLEKPTEIPGTSLKAYDYMIQPEDGAPGVFAHEYGHNLGLPDLYDTTRKGHDSPVGAWSLMSSGSHTGKIFQTQPTGFDPWSKMMLQEMYGGKWIRPMVTDYKSLKKEKKFKINEAVDPDPFNKVLKIDMPQVEKLPPAEPKDGDYSYFSDEGDNLDTKLVSEEIDLTGASKAAMSFDSWREIETGFDVLNVNVIETSSGDKKTVKKWDDSTEGKWKQEEIDLSDFAGKKIKVEFNYVTDGGLALKGFYMDNFQVEADGTTVFSDDAEGDLKFKLDGFTRFDGKGKMYPAYYLVELRSHNGVDAGLEYFRRNDTFFSYDPGVVIWYYDGRYGKTQDNNTSQHPGYGMLGVVDSHQRVHYWDNDEGNDKKIADSRYQVNDAAFGFDKTSGMNLDYIYGKMDYPGLPGVHKFSDDEDYTMPEVPEVGKILPEIGLQINVKQIFKNFERAVIEAVVKK